MSKKTKRLIDEAFSEMFRRVGIKTIHNQDDVLEFQKQHGDEWYRSHTWSEKEEQDFSLWLQKKIRTRLKVTKHKARQEAGLFLLQYGWPVRKRSEK